MQEKKESQEYIDSQRQQQEEIEQILREKQQQGYQFAAIDESGEEIIVSKDKQAWEGTYRFE